MNLKSKAVSILILLAGSLTAVYPCQPNITRHPFRGRMFADERAEGLIKKPGKGKTPGAAKSVKQSVAVSPSVKADRYYVRVSGCDDGGRAYLNNNLVVDVGFDEDSNWLDITEDVAQGKDEIKFEVINRTGAITYVFQVRKNDTIVFEQACGKAKEIGCENNRAFRVGKARKFTYAIRRDK